MIKVIVAGAGGRMGGRLISLIGESKSLRLAGAIGKKGHPAGGRDAGEVAASARLGISIADDLTTLAANAGVLLELTSSAPTVPHVGLMARREKHRGNRT